MSWSDRWIAEGKDIGMRSEIDNQAAKIIQLEAQLAAVQNKQLSAEALKELHHIEEFGLFCSFDEFEQIARTIEHEHGIDKAIAGEATEQPLKSGRLANE